MVQRGAPGQDEWTVQHARNMTLETIASLGDDPFVKLPAVTAR